MTNPSPGTGASGGVGDEDTNRATGFRTGEEDEPGGLDLNLEQHPRQEDDPKRSAALFLLKTREERKVTQTALNVQDVNGLYQEAMDRLQVTVNLISRIGGEGSFRGGELIHNSQL